MTETKPKLQIHSTFNPADYTDDELIGHYGVQTEGLRLVTAAAKGFKLKVLVEIYPK